MSGAPKPVFVDPLPSWNEGTTKATILDFVRRVTIEDSSDYVPPSEQIGRAHV